MAYDMEALLDAIRRVESDGKDNEISPVGAKGPYQFMDPTAREYGLDEKTVFDPVKSRGAARRYIGDLLKRYDGDLNKALAAWNWGMGNLEREGYNAMPLETSNFITRVMTSYKPSGTPGDLMRPGKKPTVLAEAPTTPSDALSLFPTQAIARKPAMSLFPDSASRFDRTIQAGSSVPPDRAARIYKLGLRTGLPEDLIDRNLESIESEIAKKEFDPVAFRRESPLVSAWLSDSKNKAAIAKLDYEGLSALEKAWAAIKVIPGEFGRGVDEDRLMQLSSKVVFGTATPDEIAERGALKDRLTAEAVEHEGLPSWTAAAAKVVGQNLPLGVQSLEFGAAAGLAAGATGAALGLIGGPAAPVTAAAGALVGATTGLKVGTAAAFTEGVYSRSVGEAYDQLETATDAFGERLDPTVARFAAMLVGAPNAALEMLSATKALKVIPGGERLLGKLAVGRVKNILVQPSISAALKNWAKKYASAVATETITEGLQELNVIIAEEIATEKYELPDRQDVEQILGASEQAFKASVVLGASGLAPKMIEANIEINRAKQNQEVINKLGEMAQSKFAQTSPEAFGDLTTRLSQDAAVKELFIPIEQWDSVFGANAANVTRELFGTTDQYYEAKAHNGDIAIPTGLYAEKIAGTQFHQQLAQDIRFGPGDMTFREAQAAEQLLPELEQDVEMEAAKTLAKETELNLIRDDVKGKLAETGMNEISADRNAMVWREVFAARAEVLGVDPLQLYRETPFEVRRDEVPGAGALAQKERGFFEPGSNTIGLLKNADPSTFLHESAHFWFEMMRRDAFKPGTSEQFRKDWETVKAWSGATDEGISVEAHEQFARGVEAYFMEGKSPSLTLREAFAQFAQWLTKIYKSLVALDVELTPEVRDVMDRMFATEQAIKDAREYNGYNQFNLPVDSMTAEEAAAYQKLNAQARFEAEENLRTAVMKQFTRENLVSWRQAKESTVRKIREEMAANKDWRTLTWLQRGKLPDGTDIEGLPHQRLSMEAVKGLGFDPKTLPHFSYQREGGVSPTVLAELFGYRDGRDLIQKIMALPLRTQYIEAETISRMQEQFGDLYSDPRAIADAAAIEVQNAKQIEMFSMELRILKRLGARKEQTRPAILKDLAHQIISRKKVGELEPRVYEQASIKAGNAAQDAIIERDYNKAFEEKQRQMLNVFMYKEAAKLKQEINKTVDKWHKTLFKPDARITHTRDVNLMNVARAIAASHGIGASEGSALNYLAQVQQYDPQTYDDLKDIVDLATSDARPWKQLTVDEFKTLEDAIEGATALSLRSKKMEIEGKLIERSTVRAELASQLAAVTKSPVGRIGVNRAVTGWDKFKINLAGVKAHLRRVEHWVDAADYGNRKTPFRKYIWQPISDASIAFRHARKQALEKYLGLLEGYQKSLTAEKIAAPEIDYEFASKAELVAALLHTGNDSNFSKLLRGRGWGGFKPDGELDTSRWDRFVERAHRESIITKQDYEFVQAVWDLLDGFKPGAQQTHKKVYGYYFNEVTARPFNTPFGNFNGGYFPAKVDQFMSDDAQLRADRQALDESNPATLFPSVARGFTKARTEAYAAPLDLNLGLVPRHISDVLRFTFLASPTRDIARLVNDKQFRSILEQLDHGAASEMLIPWLSRSGNQIVEQPSTGRSGKSAANFYRWVRTNTGLAFMFGNVINTLEQFTGIAQAGTKVKPRYLAGAMWRLVRNPMALSRSVNERSTFMAERTATQMIDIQQAIDEIVINPGVYKRARDFVHKHGYFMQVGTQNVVDLITWSGAYEQSIVDGRTEAEATRDADAVIRETQGSFAPEDISRFEAGTAFVRTFTMFTSYFNMSANLLGTEFVKAARQGGFGGAARGLYVYILAFVIPAFVSKALRLAATGALFDDDDDDGYLDNLLSAFFFGQVEHATGMVPGFGQVVSTAVKEFEPDAYSRISLTPAIAAFEAASKLPMDTYRLASDEEEIRSSKVIRDVLTFTSVALGIPVLPLARPLGYLTDVEEGHADPENTLDFTRGLITGKPGVD